MNDFKKVLPDINASYSEYRLNPGSPATEQVVRSGEALVRHFALLYGGGCCIDDLFQTGMLGLLKAVKSFDAGKGIRFSTWASCCIISEIQHFVRKERKYYYPRCIQKLQDETDQFIENAAESGRIPQPEEVAAELGITRKGVREVMKSGLVAFSDVDMSHVSMEVTSFQLPIEDKVALEQAMQALTSLQRKVIEALFYRGMTQEEAAAELGINQRKVSRIRQKGLDLLRELLRGPNFGAAGSEPFRNVSGIGGPK